MNGKPSPCDTCTRVKDPEKCKNIECAVWRPWWLEKWNSICLFLLARLK